MAARSQTQVLCLICLCSATELQLPPAPTLPSCRYVPKIQLSLKLSTKGKGEALHMCMRKGQHGVFMHALCHIRRSVESFGVFHDDYKSIHTLFSYCCVHRLPFLLTSSPSTSMEASPSSPVLYSTTYVPQPISHGVWSIQDGTAPRCVCV